MTKIKLLILWILLGGTAQAITCKEHREFVSGNFIREGWKVISVTQDTDYMSITFRKLENGTKQVATFFYSTNQLLSTQAEVRGMDEIDAECLLNSKPARMFFLSLKRVFRA